MPSTAPEQAKQFHPDFASLGTYVQDDSRIPYFNPSDSGISIHSGEPVLVQWQGASRVFVAQSEIHPGDTGMLLRRWTQDFPANLSAQSIFGAEVYWDIDNNEVALEADVTNGFLLGDLSYALPAGTDVPSVDGNDRVIAAEIADTRCRVIGRDAEAVTKGIVTTL